MIKLTKRIQINILTIPAVALSVIFHYHIVFMITYAVMLLHEAAHCAAALCIGLKIDCVVLQPFGVNLRLKNKMIYSLSDEIILYISGPLVNAFFAVAALVIYKYFSSPYLRLFYAANTALFVMNLLPAAPLDGGLIVKGLLTHRLGFRAASKLCTILSAVIFAATLALGIYIVLMNRQNFTFLLFSLLILGNIFTQKEKYDVDFLNTLMLGSKKQKKRVRHIAARKEDLRGLASRFSAGAYTIVYIIDDNGKIIKTLTETEILNRLL